MDSISFPAVGTGNLGYPKDGVASLMLDEILAFSQERKPAHLKEVVIVLFPGDGQTLQVKPQQGPAYVDVFISVSFLPKTV